MNVSSSTTSSADWAQLLMQRAASSSQTSQTGQTGSQQFAFSMDDGPPPPPPMDSGSSSSGSTGSGSSDLQMPTTSMGGHHHHVHGGGDGDKDKDPLAALDSNGDGSISSDEFGLSSASDSEKKLFSAIDTNGDGTLSSTELSDFKTKMHDAFEAKRAAEKSDSTSGDSSVAGKATDALTKLLSAIDTNGDGALSSTEISDFKTAMSDALQATQTGGASTSSDGSSSSSSSGTSSDSSSAAALQAMLQRISQDYLSLSASGFFGSSTGSTVNLTA